MRSFACVHVCASTFFWNIIWNFVHECGRTQFKYITLKLEVIAIFCSSSYSNFHHSQIPNWRGFNLYATDTIKANHVNCTFPHLFLFALFYHPGYQRILNNETNQIKWNICDIMKWNALFTININYSSSYSTKLCPVQSILATMPLPLYSYSRQ